MTNDAVYWLFTASAQTVAAFVAFLLAGFALVLSMMESVFTKDPTLEDVHHALKKQYYRRLRTLLWLTAIAIVLDLLVVVLQGTRPPSWAPVLQTIAVILNVLAIVLAVLFILLVVDPDRYRKTARSLLASQQPPSQPSPTPPTGPPQPPPSTAEFMAAYIPLERRIRDLAARNDLSLGAGPQESFAPLSRILAWLARTQALPTDLSTRLAALSRYRNLVVHGQLESVDSEKVREAHALASALDALLPRVR